MKILQEATGALVASPPAVDRRSHPEWLLASQLPASSPAITQARTRGATSICRRSRLDTTLNFGAKNGKYNLNNKERCVTFYEGQKNEEVRAPDTPWWPSNEAVFNEGFTIQYQPYTKGLAGRGN